MADIALTRLPSPWKGLFAALGKLEHPEELARLWYMEAVESQYGHCPVWSQLLRNLAVEDPVIQEMQLTFKPRFLLLSPNLQRLFLCFLQQHVSSILDCDLHHFVCVVKQAVDQFSEIRELLGKLSKSFGVDHLVTDKNYPDVDTITYPDVDTILKHPRYLCAHLVNSKENSGQSGQDYVPMETEENLESEEPTCSDMKMHQYYGKDRETEEDVIIVVEDDEEEQSILCHRGLKQVVDVKSGSKIMEKEADYESVSLPPDIQQKIIILRERLMCETEPQSSQSSQTFNEMEFFFNCSPEQVDEICRTLDTWSLSEIAVQYICQKLISLSDSLSYNNCVHLLSNVLYPKVKGLTQTASRLLASVVMATAEKFPKQLIDSVLVQVVSEEPGSPEADLICRVIKESQTDEQRRYFMQRLRNKTVKMNENFLSVLQMVIDTKTEINEEIISWIVALLTNSATEYSKNLKYGKVVLAVVDNYGMNLSQTDLSNLSVLIDKHGTFLKKTIGTTLKKLKTGKT
ncbi:hypothetical protein CHS0354_036649 [Potamilus streckersoni]|uniref:Fanconi Anaemia group E protein C-terminal domain-containing protein n=1 Tax=Potamilus streckersoni TaxID=2493646 RepID=A0AAE0SRU8_9BIVA|nr:hypothetical protein CHS0354_036649 [Potamilus streckersoni]